MRLSPTNRVAVLIIVAGGAVGGLLLSRSGDVAEDLAREQRDIEANMERLAVSTNPPLVPMPLLLGLEQANAEALLDSLALELTGVEYGFRFGRDQGRVLEQSPPPDSLVSPGSLVRLVVGRRSSAQPVG